MAKGDDLADLIPRFDVRHHRAWGITLHEEHDGGEYVDADNAHLICEYAVMMEAALDGLGIDYEALWQQAQRDHERRRKAGR